MTRFNLIKGRWQGVGLTSVLLAAAMSAAGQGDDALQSEEDPVQAIDAEVQGEGDAEAEAEGQAPLDDVDEIDEAAGRAALQSELASAKRFEAELTALLQPDGQLDTTQGDAALTKLASLAMRCGILANSAMDDEVRLVLLGYQARALSALVSLDHNETQDGPDWIDQLAEAAAQIAALQHLPGAASTADYWSLIVELSSPPLPQQTTAQRQGRAETLLRAYIQTYGEDAGAAEYLLDTRLSLATLLDQRGAQREAAAILDRLGELPPDSLRVNDIKRLRESVGRRGKPIAFELISTELMRWRSSDHAGKPVLIHVYADSVDASVQMIDVISRSIVEGSLGGIAVVSLRVGEPIAAKGSPPWPTLPVQLEPNGVLDQLGVTALPTLAWLDGEGKLVSIGTTAAVLNQFASINSDEPDVLEVDDQTQAQPDAQPEAQPDADTDPAAEAQPGPDEADVEKFPF